MRVLVVEDDLPLQGGLRSVLELAGYRTAVCSDGMTASTRLQDEPFDLVVMDLGLPRLDGLEVLRRFRAKGDATPVLILSARDQTHERVLGLDAGADDYLNKPFERTEFEARVRALLRRRRPATLQIGSLVWAWERKCLTIHGDEIRLTRNEATILELLMRSPGKIMSKSQLATRCSTDHLMVSDNEIEVYIYRLRRKLLPAKDADIQTVRGLGYCLRASDEAG